MAGVSYRTELTVALPAPATQTDFGQEGHMHDYEIRIFTGDCRTSHIFDTSLPSDFAAIRRAQTLARPGQRIEVWRGSACIYADRGEPAIVRLRAAPVAAERGMADYEIRILRADFSPSLIWKSSQLGDDAAIRAGMRAAGGLPLEIWRDMDCIFRAPATGL